jgi:hypothetical protein
MSDLSEAAQVNIEAEHNQFDTPLRKLPHDVVETLVELLRTVAEEVDSLQTQRIEHMIAKHFEKSAALTQQLQKKLHGLVKDPDIAGAYLTALSRTWKRVHFHT